MFNLLLLTYDEYTSLVDPNNGFRAILDIDNTSNIGLSDKEARLEAFKEEPDEYDSKN